MAGLQIKFPHYAQDFQGKLNYYNRLVGTCVPFDHELRADTNDKLFLINADGEPEIRGEVVVKFIADFIQEDFDGEIRIIQ